MLLLLAGPDRRAAAGALVVSHHPDHSIALRYIGNRNSGNVIASNLVLPERFAGRALTRPRSLMARRRSLMRATPPHARMSDGTRSRAMTATAASSERRAQGGLCRLCR